MTATLFDIDTACACGNRYCRQCNPPETPYNGSSGWSGSRTSKARADSRDADGTTGANQTTTLALLNNAGPHGLTWHELADTTGWHHGTASGVLSVLHKTGRIDRLTETRKRSKVYVSPAHVNGRPTETQGRVKECPHCGGHL